MRIVAALTFMGFMFAGSAALADRSGNDTVMSSKNTTWVILIECETPKAKACGGKVLIRQANLKKGATCGKVPRMRTWKAYSSRKVDPKSKEWQAALALAAEANEGGTKGLCYAVNPPGHVFSGQHGYGLSRGRLLASPPS